MEYYVESHFCRASRAKSFTKRKFAFPSLTSHTNLKDKVTSNTFSIEKVVIFNCFVNLFYKFEKGVEIKHIAHRPLQH